MRPMTLTALDDLWQEQAVEMRKATRYGRLYIYLAICKPRHDDRITYCDKKDANPLCLNNNTLGIEIMLYTHVAYFKVFIMTS